MPPSINECYAQVGSRRITSSSLKKFKGAMQRWGFIHKKYLCAVRGEILESNKKKIALSFLFYFPKKKLKLKASNTPKKLDTSNRIKPAEDAVMGLIGIDDRHVFKLSAEKVEGEKECFDCLVYVYD